MMASGGYSFDEPYIPGRSRKKLWEMDEQEWQKIGDLAAQPVNLSQFDPTRGVEIMDVHNVEVCPATSMRPRYLVGKIEFAGERRRVQIKEGSETWTHH